ncbi:MAG: TIR domain-containing protein [Gordonia paraffinivorans]
MVAILPTERPAGFWSYVRKDDDAMHGKIVRLMHLIKEEFDFLTGYEMEIFVDREGIEWGEKWQQTIDQAIAEATFLIPIITPRFFQSSACRKELTQFQERAKSRGVPELVLPIIYSPVDDLTIESSNEAKRAIAATQHISFIAERRLDEESEAYCLKVTEMAERLIEVTNRVATASRDEVPSEADASETMTLELPIPQVDESPSMIDVLAAVEAGFDAWTLTLNKFKSSIDDINRVTGKHAPRVQRARSKNSVSVLLALRAYADELLPTARDFLQSSLEYTEQAKIMNNAIEDLIYEMRKMSYADRMDEGVYGFYVAMVDLAQNGRVSVAQVTDFQASAKEVSTLSKEVRVPLAMIDQGNQNFIDGQDLLDEWVARLAKLVESDEAESGSASNGDAGAESANPMPEGAQGRRGR